MIYLYLSSVTLEDVIENRVLGTSGLLGAPEMVIGQPVPVTPQPQPAPVPAE